MTDIPVAEVIAVKKYRGLLAIRVLCPHCGRTHLHPGRAGDTAPHTAHCAGSEYRIPTEGERA